MVRVWCGVGYVCGIGVRGDLGVCGCAMRRRDLYVGRGGVCGGGVRCAWGRVMCVCAYVWGVWGIECGWSVLSIFVHVHVCISGQFLRGKC